MDLAVILIVGAIVAAVTYFRIRDKDNDLPNESQPAPDDGRPRPTNPK